jgi:hypothetical protein
VDGIDDDYMPWEVVASSVGIVYEMEAPDSFTIYYFGAFNGWDWTETPISGMWDDGKLTIMWTDTDFDPRTVTEEDNGVKMGFGNWNGFTITRIYLLVDESLLP